MDINHRKQELLGKYLNNKCSPAELEELFGYLKSDDDEAYHAVMKDLWNEIGAEKNLKKEKADRLLKHAIRADKPVVHSSRVWYRIAAAVLALVIGIGSVYLLVDKKKPAQTIAHNMATEDGHDINPGSFKAILQAGAAQVALNERDTSFTLAGNIVHINNGNIKVTDAKVTKYTLIVPRGGEYNLVLSDGTKVWLNAESKLIYPSRFTGGDRAVSLEGEAYFEVTKNAGHPFIVHTRKQDIQVLGTEFNVHAYSDENKVITTLVNGSVRISSFGEKMILKPGEQVISENGRASVEKHADIKQAIAWKEGYFFFNNTSLYDVMNQLSRWYDVQVNYAADVRSHEFMAIISRDNNISQVLEMLEASGVVQFKIKRGEVTVTQGAPQ